MKKKLVIESVPRCENCKHYHGGVYKCFKRKASNDRFISICRDYTYKDRKCENCKYCSVNNGNKTCQHSFFLINDDYYTSCPVFKPKNLK